MNTLFQRLILSRLWLTFVVLGLSFLAFGAATLNLGLLLMANTRLLRDYGGPPSGRKAAGPRNLCLARCSSLREGQRHEVNESPHPRCQLVALRTGRVDVGVRRVVLRQGRAKLPEGYECIDSTTGIDPSTD